MNEPLRATPFRIDVPQAVLDDLRERLARTRWPDEPQAAPWRYGTDLAWMQDVCNHWLERYDWRKHEERINAFPQFQCEVDGQRIHFIMEKGSGPAPLPLVITHGWPGSIVEFLHVIEPLAHPERFGGKAEDGFTVVAPSIPGFGFSGPPPAPVSTRHVAGLWHKLMTEVLGFKRYVAQGGDYGGIITSWLAFDHPEPLAAIHLNMLGFRPPVSGSGQPPNAEELAWLAASEKRRDGEAAYQQIQGTKPQSLAYALTDSPVGMAAWILEKFHGWTTPGSPHFPMKSPPFDIDDLLTNVMLYWVNGINAANWMYVSIIDPANRQIPKGTRVEVPTGLLLCPNDLTPPAPESWARRAYNVARYKVPSSGGHFAALELGPVFVEEVREFFRAYR